MTRVRASVLATEVLPGDLLIFHDGREVVSVELPETPGVIVSYKTTTGPCFAGMASTQVIERDLPDMAVEAAHDAALKTFDAIPGVVSAELLVHGYTFRAYPDGFLEVLLP